MSRGKILNPDGPTSLRVTSLRDGLDIPVRNYVVVTKDLTEQSDFLKLRHLRG